jgi:hypothetical protein
MASKKDSPAPPAGSPEIVDGPTVDGVHDLSDHPAVKSGVIRNPGDTVHDRDPNAPSHRRPVLGEQSEGQRKTTTKDPEKSVPKSPSRGDGAGPES